MHEGEDPHILPLSGQALDVLALLHRMTAEGTLLFPAESYPKRPIQQHHLEVALQMPSGPKK
jgi:hypothetical protein